MRRTLEGRARRLGDDINTDYIITSARKRDTLDTNVLRQYLLETVDPGFAASVRMGDIIVAGRNFGCGSAMEIAATVILAAGIQAVVATSFSQTFYRNAVNNGLLPVECETSGISEADRLTVQLAGDHAEVVNSSTGASMSGVPLPPIMLDILEAGGLAPYIVKHQGFAL